MSQAEKKGKMKRIQKISKENALQFETNIMK